MDQCWFQMVSGHTCFQLVFSFTHFSRGVVLGFFHTLSHHPAQWRQTNMVPFCWKLLNKFSKKNTCLKWWCINIISEKTMLKDYCNSNFAGQKTKEEMVFFLHVRLKMRDWNWDNPSCIHHPWIGIIRCSMIFLYPLVESGCTTDRKKSCPRSQDFLRQQGTSVITCTKHDWKIHPHDSPPAWCWYSSCKLWKKYI